MLFKRNRITEPMKKPSWALLRRNCRLFSKSQTARTGSILGGGSGVFARMAWPLNYPSSIIRYSLFMIPSDLAWTAVEARSAERLWRSSASVIVGEGAFTITTASA